MFLEKLPYFLCILGLVFIYLGRFYGIRCRIIDNRGIYVHYSKVGTQTIFLAGLGVFLLSLFRLGVFSTNNSMDFVRTILVGLGTFFLVYIVGTVANIFAGSFNETDNIR